MRMHDVPEDRGLGDAHRREFRNIAGIIFEEVD